VVTKELVMSDPAASKTNEYCPRAESKAMTARRHRVVTAAATVCASVLLAGCGSPAPQPAGDKRVEAGAAIFRRCTACHTIGRDASDTDGPNLYGVVGAPVAERRPRYGYTAGLKSLGGVWTAERLDTWLTNPRRMVPGTTMAFGGLSNADDRANVIAFLSTQGPQK
jgi:cytochrome c